jgi:hypothetical protein
MPPDDPSPVQRVVLCTGEDTFLLYGDPDRLDPRYWDGDPDAPDSAGAALPVLLREGWNVEAVHPLSPQSSGKQTTVLVGTALIVLRRTSQDDPYRK